MNPSLLPHLAHELRTPLGGLSAALDVLSYANELSTEELAEALSVAKRQVDRLASLTEVLDVLGAETREPAGQDLALALSPAWAMARAESGLPNVPLALQDGTMVLADPQPLYKALLYLLRYALAHLHGARPTVQLQAAEVVINVGQCTVARSAATARVPLMLSIASTLVATFDGKIALHGQADIEGFTLVLRRSFEQSPFAEPIP